MPSAKKQLTKKSTPVWPIKLILNKATSTTTLDYAKKCCYRVFTPHRVVDHGGSPARTPMSAIT